MTFCKLIQLIFTTSVLVSMQFSSFISLCISDPTKTPFNLAPDKWRNLVNRHLKQFPYFLCMKAFTNCFINFVWSKSIFFEFTGHFHRIFLLPGSKDILAGQFLLLYCSAVPLTSEAWLILLNLHTPSSYDPYI